MIVKLFLFFLTFKTNHQKVWDNSIQWNMFDILKWVVGGWILISRNFNFIPWKWTKNTLQNTEFLKALWKNNGLTRLQASYLIVFSWILFISLKIFNASKKIWCSMELRKFLILLLYCSKIIYIPHRWLGLYNVKNNTHLFHNKFSCLYTSLRCIFPFFSKV